MFLILPFGFHKPSQRADMISRHPSGRSFSRTPDSIQHVGRLKELLESGETFRFIHHGGAKDDLGSIKADGRPVLQQGKGPTFGPDPGSSKASPKACSLFSFPPYTQFFQVSVTDQRAPLLLRQ
jgi:hypothetical protein